MWRSQIRRFSSSAFHAARDPKTTPVIVSAVRTPIGSYGGKFKSLSSVDLGIIAAKGAMDKINLDASQVSELICGNVFQANAKQGVARQITLKSGIPENCVTTTVNKLCASGLKSISLAAQSIMLGYHDIVIGMGTESMSNIPHYVDGQMRFGLGFGHHNLVDAMNRDGLQDSFTGLLMGNFAEETAKIYNISREDQDKYAVQSYQRASEATQNGVFKDEIVPVTVQTRKSEEIVVEDEEFKNLKLDKVPHLKSPFEKGGSVTVVNSSKISDGASAVILMSEARAKELGLKPLARILGFADAELPPQEFTISPSKAIPLALKRAGVKIQDVDYFEINEAFAVVALANMKLLGIDDSKVNLHGGAVSQGHPVGCSGARIATHAAHYAKQLSGNGIWCVGICNGGGGGTALVGQAWDE